MKMEYPISPSKRYFSESRSAFYPFGGKQCRNSLLDFPLSSKIKILFLRCHDLRTVLETVASQTVKDACLLNISLNHSCSLSLTRNILILKVISDTNFDVNNPEDMNYLWDLWYNLQWPKTTLDRFIKDIQSLIEKGIHQGCKLIVENSILNDTINTILKCWLSLSLSENLTETSLMEKTLKERSKLIAYQGLGDAAAEIGKSMGLISKETLSATVNVLTMWRDSAMDANGLFPKHLKKKLSQETRRFYETGNYNLTSKFHGDMNPNPTLLEPETLRWRVDCNCCPLDSYFPLPMEELETSATEGIATRYCQKVLKNLVTAFQNSKKKIHFQLHQMDDLKFCLCGTTEKFDVIDTSSLADDVGLANLLEACNQRLESHPNAVLISETSQWFMTASTVALYVEESLCTPLSMIPTIYGFRLKNNIELGSTSLAKRELTVGFFPKTLWWLRSPSLENVPLSISPSLKKCLKILKEKCFVLDFDNEKFTTLQDSCGSMSYSPQTFNCVVKKVFQLVEKQEGESWIKSFQSKIDSVFRLAQKTLDACNNGLPVTLFTVTQPFTSQHEANLTNCSMLLRAPLLRLILIPSEMYLQRKEKLASSRKTLSYADDWGVELPYLHYIDNFDLSLPTKQTDSLRTFTVSFLLPEDFDIVKTHSAVIVDIITGLEMYNIGSIEAMQHSSVTFETLANKLLPATQDTRLKAAYCQESENGYIIRVNLPSSTDNPEDLILRSDQQAPCLSGHRIIFSLGAEELTLCFPYPVLVENLKQSIVRRIGRSYQVVLKKALYEPWPCQFNETSKWNLEKFALWKEPRVGVNLLKNHIKGVYDPADAHLDSYSSPLNEVRALIATIFSHASDGFQYYNICKESDHQNPLWFFRVHTPILKSPFGGPMLSMTALDHGKLKGQLLEKFLNGFMTGNVPTNLFDKYFKRIYEERNMKPPLKLLLSNDQTAVILQYVLRLNSTKMLPTSWQEKNIPPGNSSPYLATFISLLYLDNHFAKPRDDDPYYPGLKNGSELVSNSAPLFESNVCSGCMKKGTSRFKRCARCKMAYYCNVECQRAHWAEHKVLCVIFK